MQEEKMYSVKVVAFRFWVSPDTIHRLIRRGILKAWRLPMKQDKRKGTYTPRRISESEVTRLYRTCFTD